MELTKISRHRGTTMRAIHLIVIYFGMLLLSVTAVAQDNAISLDHVDGLYNNDPNQLETGVPITFHLRFENAPAPNVANITGATNGFRVYSPDGALWSPITHVPYWDLVTCFCVIVVFPGWDGPLNLNDAIFINPYSITGSGADTIGLGGNSKFPSSGVQPGFSEVVYTISTQLDASQHGKTLCLDSSYYPPANDWLWSTDTGSFGDVLANWDGPHCFTIRDPNFVQPSNLVISTDSLFFSAIEGGASPASQNFDISSDFDPLSFNLSEGAGWLALTPTSGATPENVSAFVSVGLLSAGTYYETITITSPTAANSPEQVVVTFEIDPPPPTIGVDQTLVQFFAIVDGANPDDKKLAITNDGGSTLLWSVSKFSSWLTLSPLSGIDADSVTLSVDITGLVFGEYFDTIFVSDPAATNDPVEVEVKLTVGSNLPVIEVDSSFNYILVPDGTQTLPPRKITVRNGGIGNMDFWLVENTAQITSLTPTSGTAPQDVDVEFKVVNGATGTDIIDTLWVYSNEAVNSPFPVVFLFHYVEVPAFLTVNRDTIEFTLYQCDQGVFGINPTEPFYVQNTGGDDPVTVNLLYDSPLFASNLESGIAPQEFVLTGLDSQEPLGVYYDTILVSAINAINAPETLIVKTTVGVPFSAPSIYLDTDSIVINYKEGHPPSPMDYRVMNRWGGCMPWTIDEDIPWALFSDLSGEVPGSTQIAFDSYPFLRGGYVDSFLVNAPVANNDPRLVDVRMNVWWHRGDINWNGKINVSDNAYFIAYLFGNPTGQPPIPEMKVADVNCDGQVNVADLAFLVNYLFGIPTGPFPCSDP